MALRLFLATVIGLTTLASAGASEYFVSPTGDDDAVGSREAPWRTLERASQDLEAGDVVTLLPGAYAGTWRPETGGASADRRLTLRAETEGTATLVADGQDGYAVFMDGLEHVALEGLHITPEPSNGRWMRITNCSDVVVDRCWMSGGTGGMPFLIEACDGVTMRDTVLRRFIGGNMARIAGCERVLIEGCDISRTGHSPLQFYPERSNHFVVIRGCVFHNGWGRNFEHFTTQDLLFEHNIVTNALNGGRSADAPAKCASERSIFRFNRVFRNWGGPLNGNPYWIQGDRDRPMYFRNARLYHNVFHDNHVFGFQSNAGIELVEDVIFQNNIFARNDRWGGNRQVHFRGGGPERLLAISNVITGTAPGQTVIEDEGAWTVAQAQSEEFTGERGARYLGNLDAAPGFTDPTAYDHTLSADSPAIDAGQPLTQAVGDGEGSTLRVEDGWAFYDGFGIPGEQGDLICVGRPDQRARIVSGDRAAGVFELDREVSWSDGDPVSLPWSGEAPDIGCYEAGGGAPQVRIIAEPFVARVGEPVTLRAQMRGGIDAASYRWRFTDGGSSTEPVVTQACSIPSDYAVALSVVDTGGNTHRASGYFVVEQPREPGEPLLHTTFDATDESWWWRWQAYRPRPAEFERILDDEGNGVLRCRAPADRGRLPCWTQPREWQIDHDSVVRVRYRVGEGTPLGLFLRAFSTPEDGTRRACVAATPAAKPGDQMVTDEVLIDDGQWHELTLDARLIRERFPEVEVLEALRFYATPRGDVTEGMWFEVDEVYIGPE